MDANKSEESSKVITQSSPKLNKVVVIGDTFVGKTSIITRLISDSFGETKPTIGAQHQMYKAVGKNNEEVILDLWDTAGQERYRSVVPMYYKGAKGIIIVFDITNRESFEGAKRWVEEIESYSNTAVLSLVGNKVDAQELRQIGQDVAKAFASQHKLNYYESSAKDGLNIKEIFDNIAEKIPKANDSGSKLVVSDMQSNSKSGICC